MNMRLMAPAETPHEPAAPRERPARVRALRRVPVRDFAERLLIFVAAIAVAMLAVSAMLVLDGRSPMDAFTAMWDGALSDPQRIGVTANRAVPFVLAGLGFVIAYRAGLLNVGAEGQIFLGGAAAGAFALKLGTVISGPAGVGLALIAGAAAGAAISLIAAGLYLWRNVSVVLSTLLLNFVGIQLVSYLVRTPWLLQEEGTVVSDADGGSNLEGVARSFPQSDQIANEFRLPKLVVTNPAHAGVVIALIALVFTIILLRNTTIGFRIRALGANAVASLHAGVPVRGTVVAAMAMCGALGGLAGAVIVMGDRYRVLEAISDNYGFVAILAALLARTSPIGTVIAAFFFAALQRGGQVMEASGVAPSATVLVVQGLVVIFIACGLEGQRRWSMARSRRRGKEA